MVLDVEYLVFISCLDGERCDLWERRTVQFAFDVFYVLDETE